MEQLLVKTYAKSIMANAARKLQSLKDIQLMEIKFMTSMPIGDRLKITGKFIPWYVLYCIFNKNVQNIDEKYIAIAHEDIIEGDEYEESVIEQCKVYTKDVIDNLNDNYIKQLGKQNIQGKDILTLANDMNLFE